MNRRRKYDMSNRAAAREETRRRIIAAMLDVFPATPYPDIRIDDIAARAGVTGQTVIRHFGGKAGLMVATTEASAAIISLLQTAEVADGPLDGVIAALCETYERFGDAMAKLFAEVHLVEGLAEVVARGRADYLAWLDRALRPHLDPTLSADARAIRMAQLVAVCDIATWRLLRREGGLDPEHALQAFSDLIRSVLGHSAQPPLP
ncbi:transcriptional regulator, TetR family [Xylanimonas cellulosilytica DSM 15894]|uniref:Transcriptional regulator, TetR family n=1 Tax=Xylanimonas cellulosilytica (strain DSM 15894 / JCM 12276 / CECT 5975 / KCTC 9989 / LMG 20990 / NBRC 107835 / XIL07) TaxID=446471 RepID=D1BRF8_XYLCX|nr:TetR/AcrR family transcriptional regulator [Xylanimonas cellulosilytica]ACZ30413.1 transcriptional regulator, TetR family [Xylanimonas cellulosilytica DSM 15894]